MGQYTQHGGWEGGVGKGVEGRLDREEERDGEGSRGWGGGKKGKHRKGKKTELTKRNSPTEDAPGGAVANELRLHLTVTCLHIKLPKFF
jgi:hypothetical protein